MPAITAPRVQVDQTAATAPAEVLEALAGSDALAFVHPDVRAPCRTGCRARCHPFRYVLTHHHFTLTESS